MEGRDAPCAPAPDGGCLDSRGGGRSATFEATLGLEPEEEPGEGYVGRFVENVYALVSMVSSDAATFGYEHRRWTPARLVSSLGILLALAFVWYGLIPLMAGEMMDKTTSTVVIAGRVTSAEAAPWLTERLDDLADRRGI